MKSLRHGVVVTGTVAALLLAGGVSTADVALEPAGHWDQIITDQAGRLVAARGEEHPGVPMVLQASSERHGAKLVTRASFQVGGRSLSIERTFDGEASLDTIYETLGERAVVSIAFDDLTGESLVMYRLSDGEVFSLWVAENGDILSGDIKELRKALRRPSEIARLLEKFVKHRERFGDGLPSLGEHMLMPQVTCEDGCAAGCPRQCALECTFGAISCRICNVACGIGCMIGCSS